MSTFNVILPFGMMVGAVFALWFAFSRPVSMLPRWVRHAYLLLSAGMAGSGVVDYIQVHYPASEHAHSLILQARAWLAGFSLAILIVLVLAGVFPRLWGRSQSGGPPAK